MVARDTIVVDLMTQEVFSHVPYFSVHWQLSDGKQREERLVVDTCPAHVSLLSSEFKVWAATKESFLLCIFNEVQDSPVVRAESKINKGSKQAIMCCNYYPFSWIFPPILGNMSVLHTYSHRVCKQAKIMQIIALIRTFYF